MAKRLSYEKQIEKIMDEFDFIRVHAAMTAMKWVWHEKGVPSIKQLKQRAEELLTDCRRKRGWALSTGGFKASCDGRYLSLSFYIEEVHGYEEE